MQLASAPKGHYDTAETVYISGMALLKMLKHGKQGIPFEVIGLMLGSFIDDYTVQVVDVFSTPQNATAINVETQDEAFQVNMIELLNKVGRTENVVGWYHSHPGYDVFLSSTDVEQQKRFQQHLGERCIAVVVDPVKSVPGKVVIGAYRTTSLNPLLPIKEPREKTTFLNDVFLSERTMKMNDSYYILNIAYQMTKEEENMLLSLNRPNWATGFQTSKVDDDNKLALSDIKGMISCIDPYKKDVIDEKGDHDAESNLKHVGKVNPKEYIRQKSEELASHESSQLFRTNLVATTF